MTNNQIHDEQIPVPGMTRAVWEGLSPELQAALKESAGKSPEELAERDKCGVEEYGTEEAAALDVADVVRYYHEAMGHIAAAHTRIAGLLSAGKLDHHDAAALQDDLGLIRDSLYGGILYTVLEGFSPDSQWHKYWSDIDSGAPA
jgi:hypothetical protein